MLNCILPILAVTAAMGDLTSIEGLIGKGPARTDYDDPKWKARAKAIAEADRALTPEQKAERQRQACKRTNLTKRERQALRKGR